MSNVILKVGAAPVRLTVRAAQGPSGPAAMVMQTPVANVAALPTSGNSTNDGRVTEDTGNAYRWTGSSWILVGPFQGPAGPEGPQGTGAGTPIISATPPENPTNGMQWIESGTLILSVWIAAENAWIVPATNSVPANAVTFNGELLTFGGEILTFAAA